MKTVWIIFVLIIVTITLVLLLVPMFTVDLDLSKCSNKTFGQITKQLNNVELGDDITEGGCIPNYVIVTLDFDSYCKEKGFDDTTLTEDKIPSGDVIKISNLGIGNNFYTVSFNARKLFKADIDDTTILRINKNLIGTIYRYY